ncbi:MAG: hypothetical protein AAFV98_23295, partial [Chloroflexota bacterium]
LKVDEGKTPPQGLSVGRISQTMELWLADDEDGATIVDMMREPEPDLSPEASAIFQKLAAEEPPMPTMAEGSTIRDLRARLTNLDQIKEALAYVAEEKTQPLVIEEIEDTEDSETIPAAMILEAAIDESTPIETFSLEEFMRRVAQSNIGDISPLPSWERQEGRFVIEPDFLPDELPFPELDEAIEYTGTVTVQTVLPTSDDDPSDWVTDPINPVQLSHPIDSDAPVIERPEPEQLPPVDEDEIEEAAVGASFPPPPPPELPDLVVTPQQIDELPFIDFDDDDSELAQLATTLTQVALELTADATVLARDGDVVGYAGRLPMSDLDGLLEQLTVEWDKAKGSDKSRILFAENPETGDEFMVSTRGTDVGFTLSLIFSGTRPLHDIRRQSKRLIDALDAIPEPEPVSIAPLIQETEITAEVDVDRTPIAYLWLSRDAKTSYNPKQVAKVLQTELASSGWKIGDIQVDDYVYIYGQMPQTFDARETLSKLMRQSADTLNAQSEQLWDDSYLILQPGREMKQQEIQRFINFARP